MGILSRLFGRKTKPTKYAEADRLLQERLVSLRRAVEQHERDVQATLDHMEHIFKPDNFVSARLEDGVLKVTHRY